MTAPFARTTCACPECVACCHRQPGPLAPGEFERIAAFLGIRPEHADVFFWSSPGAVVMDSAGRCRRVGTITPRMEAGTCIFLDAQDRCRIHPVAPAGCALFDTHMDVAASYPRSAWLVRQQMDPAYQALRATLPVATSWQPR